MQRIDTTDGHWGAGNPATNTKGSLIRSWWLETVQEELAAIVTGLGGTLDTGNNGQIIALLQAACQENKFARATSTGGTADAITAVYAPPITALKDGMVLFAKPASANTSTTPTFTPASGVVPAYPIVKGNGAALAPGDTSGWIGLQWNATLTKWLLLNPANGAVSLNFASNAEAQAYASTTKPLSPATMQAAMQGANQSLAASGYQRLPGGLIIQWGITSSIVNDTYVTVTFPLTFPNAMFAAYASATTNVGTSNATNVWCYPVSTSQMQVYNNTDTAIAYWFAIGK